jgi:hypothetical protein
MWGGGCYIGTRVDLRVWREDELLGPAELAAVPVLSAVGVSTEVCQMTLGVLCPWTAGGPCRVTSSLRGWNPVDLTVLCKILFHCASVVAVASCVVLLECQG